MSSHVDSKKDPNMLFLVTGLLCRAFMRVVYRAWIRVPAIYYRGRWALFGYQPGKMSATKLIAARARLPRMTVEEIDKLQDDLLDPDYETPDVYESRDSMDLIYAIEKLRG